MTRLSQTPAVGQLARELGLSHRGDPLRTIVAFALTKVDRYVECSPAPIESLSRLLSLLCERLSVTVEHLRHDADLDRVAREHRFSDVGKRLLLATLDDPNTNGCLIHHPDHQDGDRRYLAIVDARGSDRSRAWFTTWHELAHLLVTPPQHAFEGFQRTVVVEPKKDPIESVVDVVAAKLAFYGPLAHPVFDEELERSGSVSFRAIEAIRRRVASEASLQSTAIAVIQHVEEPALLLQVGLGLKKSEQEHLESPQLDLGIVAVQAAKPKLRAVCLATSSSARDAGLRIFDNMRVPDRSVLALVFRDGCRQNAEAAENQDWWETSNQGPLASLPVRVAAYRRGPYVYALVTPSRNAAFSTRRRDGPESRNV